MSSTPTLDGAIAWWRAQDALVGGQLADGSGNGHHGTLVNAPVRWEPYNYASYAEPGDQYIRFAAHASSRLTAPDIAAYDPTVSQRIEVRMQALDYSNINQALLSISYVRTAFYLEGTGDLKIWTDNTQPATSDAPGFVNGEVYWVAIDIVFGAGDGVITFWKGTTDTNDPDAVSWVQISTHVGLNLTAPVHTAGVNIAAISATEYSYAGNIFRVRYAADGVVQLDVNATDRVQLTADVESFTEGSANAATVTIVNRTNPTLKTMVVDQPRYEFHNNQGFAIADDPALDIGAGEDQTIIGVYRVWTAPTGGIVCKRESDPVGDPGSYLYAAAGFFRYGVSDGTTAKLLQAVSTFAGDPTIKGALIGWAGIRDTVADTLAIFRDGVLDTVGGVQVDTTSNSWANAFPLHLGIWAQTFYITAEFVGAALFKTALSPADQLLAIDELQGIDLTPVGGDTPPASTLALRTGLGIS